MQEYARESTGLAILEALGASGGSVPEWINPHELYMREGTAQQILEAAQQGGGGIDPMLCTKMNEFLFRDQNIPTPVPTIPEVISLDLPQCYSIVSMFGQYVASDTYTYGIKEVTLKLYRAVDAYSFGRRNNSIEKLIFPNGLTIRSRCTDFCSTMTKLKTIVGAIGIASITSSAYTDMFSGTNALEDVEFVPNQVFFPISFPSAVLSDASIVSIANALDESATGQTLTMAADVKTRMQSLMGTVALDETETYHVFTADAGGATSLADFVTTTKGWTLA